METTTEVHEIVIKGGEFLIKDVEAQDIFIPEEFTEEQTMVTDMATEFLKKRVVPNLPKLEKYDMDLQIQLMEEAGELGLLSTSIPFEYDGSAQDFLTNMLLTEVQSVARGFALSMGAHTGIGTLPILYFGNESQKAKYLPALGLGTLKAAYCLTEPGSGSDALAAKTKAVLNEAGTHYILNGQKMWITNAGFADVFVVFAKVDGEKFTGFIVEKTFGGLTVGAEEDKLGIKSSSTRQVFLENVPVPVENVLGDIGKGHVIAFNILNIGRIKLAAGALGACKEVAKMSISYANERKQFNTSIGKFGAIRHKLAEQAIKIYVNEAATYRSSYDIQRMEEKLMSEGKSFEEALLGAAEEYAIECALMKVHSTEALDYVADEGLQIYGGMGYSEEAPMAGAYRDARINRIFEGTNEINRMLSVDMLFKRVLSGQIDFMSSAMAVQKELMGIPSFDMGGEEELFDRERKMVKKMKKAILMVAGGTAQKLMQSLAREQEILMNISDMMADVYLAESAMLRTEKLVGVRGEAACQGQIDMMQVFFDDAMERIALNGKRAICSWAEGDEKRMLLMGLKRFTKYEPINTKTARRRVAKQLLAANTYCF